MAGEPRIKKLFIHQVKEKKNEIRCNKIWVGQNKAYLLQVMKEIKNGRRTKGMFSVMQPSLRRLSEAEMEAISERLSHLE